MATRHKVTFGGKDKVSFFVKEKPEEKFVFVTSASDLLKKVKSGRKNTTYIFIDKEVDASRSDFLQTYNKIAFMLQHLRIFGITMNPAITFKKKPK